VFFKPRPSLGTRLAENEPQFVFGRQTTAVIGSIHPIGECLSGLR